MPKERLRGNIPDVILCLGVIKPLLIASKAACRILLYLLFKKRFQNHSPGTAPGRLAYLFNAAVRVQLAAMTGLFNSSPSRSSKDLPYIQSLYCFKYSSH